MGSGKGDAPVIGYKYYLGIDFAWCHAPVDRCTALFLDDREIYRGCFDDGTIIINKPELFGEIEGGIKGRVDVENGLETQSVNAYTSNVIDGEVPAYRGVTRTVFRGPSSTGNSRSMYMGNNPYLKRVSGEFQRIYQRIQDGAAVDQWNKDIAGIPLIDPDGEGLTFVSGTLKDQTIFINMDISSAANGFAGEDGTILGNGLGIEDIKQGVILSLQDIRDNFEWETEPSENFLSQGTSGTSGLDIGIGYVRFTTGAKNNSSNNPNNVDPFYAPIPGVQGSSYDLPQRGWIMKQGASREDIDDLIAFVRDFVVVPDTVNPLGKSFGETRELMKLLYDNINEAFGTLSTGRSLRGHIVYSGFVTDETQAVINDYGQLIDDLLLVDAGSTDHPIKAVYGPNISQYNDGGGLDPDTGVGDNGDGSPIALVALSNPIGFPDDGRWDITGGWYLIADATAVGSATGQVYSIYAGADYDIGDRTLVDNPAGGSIPPGTLFNKAEPGDTTWIFGPLMESGIYVGNFDVVAHYQRDITDAQQTTEVVLNRGGLEETWAPYHEDTERFTIDYTQDQYATDGGTNGIFAIDICGGYVEMNPAHIIRECLTDQQWGLGLPESDIDDVSFGSAAQTLFDERFGLSMAWTREVPIEDFVNTVLNHIDAVLFVDRTDGLFHLKLIRDDYDPSSLTEFTDADVVNWNNVSIKSPAELTNSVTVKYNNRSLDGEASLTVHNLAQIQKLGKKIHTTVNYPGIWQDTLATRVAQRDLITLSTSLIAGEVDLTRKAYDLDPGDVFKLTSSRYNLSGEVMRVVEVDVGDGRQNSVRVKFTQDKYNFDYSENTDLVVPPDSEFVDPSQGDPEPVDDRVVTEEPYYFFVQRNGELLAEEIETREIDIGYVFASATPPETTSIYARISYDDGSGYKLGQQVPYGPYATLNADLSEEADDTTVTLSTFKFFEDVSVNDLIQIDDEVMAVVSVDSTSQITVDRGALDTVPAYHPKGVPVLFISTSNGIVDGGFVSGDTVDVKLLDSTSSSRLESPEAYVDTVTMDSRITRPYPVGQLQLDGSYRAVWDISSGNTIEATWVHRDRTLMNTTAPPSHTDAGVGPETDVNYTISAVAYNYLGNEIAISGDLFSVDKNQNTSHTITPSDNTPSSEGTEAWSAVGIQLLTTREDSTSVQYDNWQTPEVMAYTQAEPTDLFYYESSWFDVNVLSSVYTDAEKTANVASDGDDVGFMEDIT